MNWEDKFNIVSKCLESNEDIEADFDINEIGASNESTLILRKKYPFISEDYYKFLKITDGADIAQCRLFSSTDYVRGIEMYSNDYPETKWFPFGYEAGGDPFLIGESGKVSLGCGKTSSGNFNILADSFSEFLYDVLMGPKYPSIFRLKEEEFTDFINKEVELEEDPWLAFLIEQEWLKI